MRRRGTIGSADHGGSLRGFIDRLALFGAPALVAVACLSAFGLVTRVDILGLRVSTARPSLLVLEAAALLLVRTILLEPTAHRPRWKLVGILGFLALACVGDSAIRRVGDGHEYLAMAVGLSEGRGAGGTAEYFRHLDESLRDEPGMAGLELWPHAVDSGGTRREFPHFWLYSMFASPFVASSRAIGGTAGQGFAALNLLLFTAAAAWLLPRLGFAWTSFLLVSPAIWWLDKAHPEILILTAIAVAVTSIADHPRLAMLLTATLGAQNPALAVVWLAVMVAAIVAHGHRRLAAAIFSSVAILALHPIYYYVTVHQLTGLSGAATWHWPSFQRYLAPLVDLNIGILVHFPVLPPVLVVALVCWRRWPPSAWPALASVVGLLFLASQTANVNHAGTYNPSRYGIWLIALAAPFLLAWPLASRRLSVVALQAAAAISVVLSLVLARPSRPERHLTHTWPASIALTAASPLYLPLPEIFAERTVGSEIQAALPAAYGNCAIALLSGSVPGAWPVTCTPIPVPDDCTQERQLCYAVRKPGGYSFVRVGDEGGFAYAAANHAWRSFADMAWIPGPVDWASLSDVRATSPASWIRAGEGLGPIVALQNQTELIAWTSTLALEGRVSLRVDRPMRACVWDSSSHRELACQDLSASASAVVDLPPNLDLVLVVRAWPAP